MSTTYPIKDKNSLNALKSYYQIQNPNPRNYALIILGLNTALRISDLLRLRWQDLYDERENRIREHLEIREQKTGKNNTIALNARICQTFLEYKTIYFSNTAYSPDAYLFPSHKNKNNPLSRSQAFRIVKKAAIAVNLPSHISPHSLRKTFGYHAWKQGTPPALLMDIYNHSSYKITKRYLCIEQDERDAVYRQIEL